MLLRNKAPEAAGLEEAMNIRQASYILEILKEGSISAAARKLYISQPALSQALRMAEQSLGTAIFERDSSPLRLTYAGERYLDAARHIMQIEDNLQREISDINSETRGRFLFGISRQGSNTLLPAILPKFMEKYPEVQLLLEEHGSQTLEQMTEAGEIDVSLATIEPRIGNLEYQLVEKEELFLLANPGCNLAHRIPAGTQLALTDVKDEAFISLKQGHSVRNIQDEIFSEKGVAPRILIETDGFETAVRLTGCMGGVMLCPHVYLDLADQDVLRYPLPPTGIERHSYLCWRSGSYLPRYVRDWMDLITANFNERHKKRQARER